MKSVLLLSLMVACSPVETQEVVDGLAAAFVDDCEARDNDRVANATPLAADAVHADVALCKNEVDVYALTVPPMTHVTAEITGIGRGEGKKDLDLFEVDESDDPIWMSATGHRYERLAWFNPSETDALIKYVMVDGYEKAATTYTLTTVSTEYQEGRDCDRFYSHNPNKENGPCNEILQFPQYNTDDEGYYVEHEAHYSSLRREVQYLVRWAARKTAAAFDDTHPLALMDMSERDGSIPGAIVNDLRHPEGTHVNGNDLDIAYYQLNGDNAGRAVCNNDGWFCTSDPHLLDAERSAYFMAMLMRSDHVRVVGVDTLIAPQLEDAADDLWALELLDSDDISNLRRFMAYGEGWPFHHHHLHFSWSWEDGHEPNREGEGCLNPILSVGPDYPASAGIAAGTL